MCLRRKAAVVDFVAHRVEDFGGNDNALAPDSAGLEGVAENFLAGAKRVHVRRIEEVDPGFQGAFDKRQRLLFVQHPIAPFGRAVGHHAQAQA